MKIKITQTEILAMPGVVRRKFYDFMTDRAAEYTPVQRIASLCVRYYYGMQGDGHTGFFYYNEDIEKDELAQALIILGVPEVAGNLPDAVEDGPEESFKQPDKWFIDNEQTLYDAIEEYQQSHFDDFFEIVDENYTMRPPKDGFWVGAFIVAIVFILGVIAASTNPSPEDRMLFIPIMIIGFVLTGLILVLYAKRWELSVKKDVISLRFIFKKNQIIRFGEISGTKDHSKGIIIYAHGKRLMLVSKAIRKNYGMFIAQLNLAEKIVDKQTDGFIIRLPKASIINGFIWPLICIWAFIWTFQRRDNPASIYEKIFFSMPLLVSFLYLARCLRWKVTVLNDIITIRRAFGSETEYLISDITRVNIDNHSVAKASTDNQKMHIFVNDKETAKIAIACEGYHDLSRKLQSANIPFYRNGKRWRYETIPIEDQLAVLSNFGITPKHGDFIEWLWSEWESDVVRSDPNELLMLLGTARKFGDSWESLSDDVFFFDSECVDDSNSYRIILEKLAVLSKGAFNVTNIHSEVDHANKKAFISFEYSSTEYKWDLDYNGDWFDFGVVLRINGLMMNNGSTRFFYTCDPPGEQGFIIIFSDEEIIGKLNCLTDYPFVLHISETVRHS